MTLQTVLTALSQGFAISKVINSVLQMNTPFAKSIKEALKQGYNEDQIEEYLTKGKSLSYSQKNKMLQGMTEEEKARGILYRQPKSQKNIGNILQSAATAIPAAAVGYAAGPLASAALSNVGPALARAAPQLFGAGAIPGAIAGAGPTNPANPQSIPPQTTQTTTLQPPPTQNTQVSPTNITQPQSAIQPEIKPIDISTIIDKPIIDKLDRLVERGAGLDQLKAYFSVNPEPRKLIEERAGKPIVQVLEQYLSQKNSPTNLLPESNELVENNKESAGILQEQEKISPKIEKQSLVASPKGMGEVKEIRNGKAIIEVDGKKHSIDESELVQSPLPPKEMAELWDDLVSGIEHHTGRQVSRNVEWAGYDPDANELSYKPHGSSRLYVYGDISPSDVDILTNFLTQRKSTGRNFIGPWEAGTESPIGAAMHQLIKRLQVERGGKGNEYKNRYETIYDAIEPAKTASKEAHEKRKKAKKPRID
jgi:hypothetical protein